MAGVLKTQKDIERARQQADELKQKVKKLKREIRESSGRLASSAERLCGRTVLRLLQQGSPLSPEAIITQARAIAGMSDQDAFALLAERLGEMPAQGEGARDITLDPTVRFILGETLRATPIAERSSIQRWILPRSEKGILRNHLQRFIGARSFL